MSPDAPMTDAERIARLETELACAEGLAAPSGWMVARPALWMYDHDDPDDTKCVLAVANVSGWSHGKRRKAHCRVTTWPGGGDVLPAIEFIEGATVLEAIEKTVAKYPVLK